MDMTTNLMGDTLEKARLDFASDGLAIIPNFLDQNTIAEIVNWADENQELAFHQTVYGNAYLKDGDKNLPADHTLNLNESTSLGVIAFDQIPDESPLKKIYEMPLLKDLVAYITDKEKVYPYDCPLGAINISVMKDTQYLRWHFDQSDFVVSIPLRDADQGGQYQYIRNLKTKDDPNYEEVAKVIKGDLSKVQYLEATPGSLVLFEGINTLHRVTEISGETPRLVALLGFVDRPGVTSSEYLRKIRYGRTN